MATPQVLISIDQNQDPEPTNASIAPPASVLSPHRAVPCCDRFADLYGFCFLEGTWDEVLNQDQNQDYGRKYGDEATGGRAAAACRRIGGSGEYYISHILCTLSGRDDQNTTSPIQSVGFGLQAAASAFPSSSGQDDTIAISLACWENESVILREVGDAGQRRPSPDSGSGSAANETSAKVQITIGHRGSQTRQHSQCYESRLPLLQYLLRSQLTLPIKGYRLSPPKLHEIAACDTARHNETIPPNAPLFGEQQQRVSPEPGINALTDSVGTWLRYLWEMARSLIEIA